MTQKLSIWRDVAQKKCPEPSGKGHCAGVLFGKEG